MSDTTTDEPQALPGDGLREGIVDEMRRRLGDQLLETELRPNDDLWLRVATDAWKRAGDALYDMGFEYFCFLSAIDWMPSPYGRGEDDPTEPPPERDTEVRAGVTGGDTRFQVLARVTDIRRHVGVTLKADVPDDTLTIESWFTVYAGANWHERETHEMFGIAFAGHPDLRNMYLPTEFEGFPLRKDFPLLARMVKPWPGIVDVEPMPEAEQLPEDAVVGAENPVDATPAQSDAGLGVPPAEDRAEAEAELRVVEEAPDYVAPTAPEPPAEPAPAPESAADAIAREEPGDELVEREDDIVDESEVERAEGTAVTHDEGTASGRPVDDTGEGASS